MFSTSQHPYYVYILQSQKDNNLYTGWTDNLAIRIKKHNLGKVQSTKSRRPLKLVFYEVFLNKKDALNREKFFKTGWGRRHLQNTLRYTLEIQSI